MPIDTGTTASTPGTRRSASASSMVSLRIVAASAPGWPVVMVLPGLTAITFVPNCVNWSRM
jgi:hypothetical protein